MKIKCIMGTREKNIIIKNKIYEVIKEYDRYYSTVCEDVVIRSLKKKRFIALDEI